MTSLTRPAVAGISFVVSDLDTLLQQLQFALSPFPPDLEDRPPEEQLLRDAGILFSDDRITIGCNQIGPVLHFELADTTWTVMVNDSEQASLRTRAFGLRQGKTDTSGLRVSLAYADGFALCRYAGHLRNLDAPLIGMLSSWVRACESPLDANFRGNYEWHELLQAWGVDISALDIDDSERCSVCGVELLDGGCINQDCPISDRY